MDHLDPEIQRLVEEFCSGRAGREAFSPIYRRYFNPIFGFFRRRGFLPDQCGDLTQEVFIRAYGKLAELKDPRSFEGWLFTIATNVRLNTLRSMAIQGRVMLSLDDEELTLPVEALTANSSDHPDTQLGQSERKRLLRQAIDALPEKMRICNSLRAHGHSYEQIADATKVSLQTVRSQLFEGRQRIRQFLEMRGINR